MLILLLLPPLDLFIAQKTSGLCREPEGTVGLVLLEVLRTFSSSNWWCIWLIGLIIINLFTFFPYLLCWPFISWSRSWIRQCRQNIWVNLNDAEWTKERGGKGIWVNSYTIPVSTGSGPTAKICGGWVRVQLAIPDCAIMSLFHVCIHIFNGYSPNNQLKGKEVWMAVALLK